MDAIADAYKEEALETLTGGPPPFGSVGEARASRLQRITRRFVERLADKGAVAGVHP